MINTKSAGLEKSILITEATLKLFRVAPAEMMNQLDTRLTFTHDWLQCFKNGFIVIDQNANLIVKIPTQLYEIIVRTVGNDSAKFDETFYGSYETVGRMPATERIYHQLHHYLSTYGRELIGLEARPYIPAREVSKMLPNVDFSGKNLVVIQLVDHSDILERVNDLVKTVAAPSDEIKEAYEVLWNYTSCQGHEIKSFELQIMYFQKTGEVPQNNINFLRYILYLTTGRPTIIKDRQTIDAIKHPYGLFQEQRDEIIRLWKSCNMESMAEIFNRYKPIFLAFKSFDREALAPVINKIRRLSNQYHKPLQDDCLQNVIEILMQGRIRTGSKILENASNRDLIKIMNALFIKIKGCNNRVFNIRNGKSFVKAGEPEANVVKYQFIARDIMEMLKSRIGDSYNNIIFVLPSHINYAAPTSEKQMINTYPWGTHVCIPDSDKNKSFSLGIHWMNVKNNLNPSSLYGDTEYRVDLDLHMMRADGEHFGWNGQDVSGTCVYSGDMTSAPAPLGAAESYWVTPSGKDFLMTVNKYSGPEEVDFQFFGSTHKMNRVGWGDPGNTYDPKAALFPAIPMKFSKTEDSNEKTIGLLHGNAFYFYGGNINRGIVPSDHYVNFIDGLGDKLSSMTTVLEFLQMINANVVFDELPTTISPYMEVVDLRPTALDITTLFKVIDGNIIEKPKDIELVDIEE